MTEEKPHWRFVITSLLGAMGVFVLWAVSGWLIFYLYPAAGDHGTFGDMFGAINALFSGWAFLGVVIAILLQKQELEEQRREIHESRKAQQESADALRKQFEIAQFNAHIDALNHVIIGYDRRIDRVIQHDTLNDKATHNRLLKEREQFEKQLQEAIQHYFIRIRG